MGTSRAISQIPVSFAYQSYLDSTLLEKAILSQRLNQGIVSSTKSESQTEGHVIGLAAESDTPVAFRIFGSERDSGIALLRPGQVLHTGKFTGFEYGLPFGWLGGGRGVIYVGNHEEALLNMGTSRPEMVFHRLRQKIAASANPLPALTRNWPLNFPWTHTLAGAGPTDQSGNPLFRVEPSRTLVRLRSAIIVPKTVGLIFRGSREFDEKSDGTYTLTDTTSVQTFLQFSASTDPQVALYPMASMSEDFIRLACDEGGLTLVDLGDGALTNVEVDIVRFGRI